MTVHAEDATSVATSVDVAVPPEHAFRVFTDGFDSWWDRAHHLQPGELRRVGIDPHVGGRVWEESDAGDVCVWGHVLTWDPPRVFAFSWMIGPDWDIPAPDAPGSRVTVTFTPTDGGTRVDLVHDRLDAHGQGWEKIREGVGSPGGWPGLLRLMAEATPGHR